MRSAAAASSWHTSYTDGQAEVENLSHQGGIYPSSLDVVAPYLAELIGTFLITLTFTCNTAYSGTDPVWCISATAFMWLAVVCAFRHISGAHLNPSVTMGLLIAGRLRARTALSYWFFQISGAVGAVFVSYSIGNVVTLSPQAGVSMAEVGTVEVLFSAMTCFVYLNCAASVTNNPLKHQNGFVGLAVGFSVIAGGYVAWHVSRAVLNTAIAIAILIMDASTSEAYVYAIYYLLFDVFGAFVGVGMFAAVRPGEFRRSDLMASAGEAQKDPFSSQFLAEFIGTFYIILTKALSRLSPDTDSLPDAWAVMAVAICMSYSVRDISGGHFNPAVTLSAWLTRRSAIFIKQAVSFITIQLIAGICAAAVCKAFQGKTSVASVNDIGFVKPNLENWAHQWGTVLVIECFFAFLVCYTVLTTGLVAPVPLKGHPNNIAGFAYGAVQAVAEFSSSRISSSSVNPAVVLGFDILDVSGSGGEGGNAHPQWYCIAVEMFGAVIAAGFFFITHAPLYRKALTEGDCAADVDAEKP